MPPSCPLLGGFAIGVRVGTGKKGNGKKGNGKKGNGKKGNTPGPGKKGNGKKGNLSLLTCSHTEQCLETDMNNNARSLHHNSYGKSKNIIQRADKRIYCSVNLDQIL